MTSLLMTTTHPYMKREREREREREGVSVMGREDVGVWAHDLH